MSEEAPWRPDPATDSRAAYDYTGGSVEREELAGGLAERVDGDVRFDSYSRTLYATDASAYEEVPIGVICPQHTEDVVAVMSYCAEQEIPVLPRGAGTSLAGQAVNEAVVLDFKRHMNDVEATDAEGGTATAQPGVTLGELDRQLEPHGLKFAPDPAWADKSVLGGAIGNNSTGAHSLKYGKTDAYLESCEVVLADGTRTRLGWVDIEELHDRARAADSRVERGLYAEVGRIVHEEAGTIEERYPDLHRNVSGYNLDTLIDDAREHGAVNLARLIAGSEGTLAIVTEATVSLEPIPSASAIALLTYDDVLDAMGDVEPILEHDPSALEVMDDVFLDLARQSGEFGDLVESLPAGTDSTLLVEFYGESDADARAQVETLLADRLEPGDGAPMHAVDALEAYDPARQDRFWAMRKAGLPILLSRTDDEKHWPFIEDTAVPPAHLPAYVEDLQRIFEEHDTFATYYAHAGPGVLHIRPLLNLKTEDGVAKMRSIAEDVTDLVIEYGGSISGEHGDGRARTQWNRKLYGEDLWETFRDLKSACDPHWLLNPGSVCGEFDPTESLRYGPEYSFEAGFEPVLNWENDGGFQGMVELCHGCGGCTGYQATTGDVMCPTYRATEEESTTTRGRANMLRAAMDGDLPDDPFEETFMEEVMDLCIGCKGCKHDCPSGVDMAKLKAEVTHEHHQRSGIPIRDRLFGNVERVLALGSALAPLSNWAMGLPGAGWLQERTLGIARERTLPAFSSQTFREWVDDRDAGVSPKAAEDRVLLLADPYTNYTAPEVGRAAVAALEAADVHVEVPEQVTDSGRPAYSKGLIERARETARANVDRLAPALEDGWSVVTVEPSEAIMYQADYLDVLEGEAATRVAEGTYGLFEYLDTTDLERRLAVEASDESLAYHGHCHQQAHRKDHHTVGVLRRAGYHVETLDSTCCGMAGSFGYEAEHYSMSMAIGGILDEQVGSLDPDRVLAMGASCRAQLDALGREATHPVRMLAAGLQERAEPTG